MSTRSKTALTGFLVLAGLFLLTARLVSAEGDDRTGSASGATGTPDPTSTPKVEREGRLFNFFRTGTPKPERTPGEELREKIKDRLEEGRLRSCNAREDSIKKRTTGLMGLVIRMTGKLDALVIRIKDYYTNKVVPSGKALPNYNDLVADIAAKKSALDAAITKIPDTATFDCSGDNPKGLLTDFRVAMQGVKGALKDYRSSIKNLIVAIKSLVGEDEGETPDPSISPAPTSTP